jgi:hypothetical protein
MCVIWIRFENHYVLEFKYILNVFWYLKLLSLTMFWTPPMGIYVSIEISFILGFATNLCVVFGPCHKDNVAIVNKTVWYMYLYLYLYLYLNLNLYLNLYLYLYLFLNMFNLLFAKEKYIFYFVNQTKCFIKIIV